MKHYTTHLLTVALALSASLGTARTAVTTDTDSVTYLGIYDTVMLEIAADQSKFTTHVFAPRQTVYSLSRFYAQDIDQVYSLNPELADRAPRVGEAVKIGVPNVAITRFRGPGFHRWKYAKVYYKVRPGETMYHIARTVFRMPVDTLLALNALASNSLASGQCLQVGWMSLSGSAQQIKPIAIAPLQSVNSRNASAYAAQGAPTLPQIHRGVATYTPGSGDASGQLFALYNGAPTGSLLRVGNSKTQRHAYVRVIGSLPENVRRDKVDIVVSGTAAKVLGASDRNFYVTIQ